MRLEPTSPVSKAPGTANLARCGRALALAAVIALASGCDSLTESTDTGGPDALDLSGVWVTGKDPGGFRSYMFHLEERDGGITGTAFELDANGDFSPNIRATIEGAFDGREIALAGQFNTGAIIRFFGIRCADDFFRGNASLNNAPLTPQDLKRQGTTTYCNMAHPQPHTERTITVSPGTLRFEMGCGERQEAWVTTSGPAPIGYSGGFQPCAPGCTTPTVELEPEGVRVRVIVRTSANTAIGTHVINFSLVSMVPGDFSQPAPLRVEVVVR